MFRRVIALGLAGLLVSSISVGQVDRPRVASDAEILKMGPDGWFKTYTAQNGDSTAGMVQAQTTYSDAERRRNNSILRRKPRPVLERGIALREALSQYAIAMIGATETLSGGGTVWQLSYAGIPHRVEELIYQWLTGVKLLGTQTTPAVVRTTIKKSRVFARTTNVYDKKWRGEALEKMQRAEGYFSRALEQAVSLPQRDYDRVLRFCLDYADVEDLMLGA